MSQLELDINSDAGPRYVSPERRIDITLGRLTELHEAMPEEERRRLDGSRWWMTCVAVSRVRAMERGEEEAMGRPSKGLADTYDRVVQPGDQLIEALLRTFAAVYAESA